MNVVGSTNADAADDIRKLVRAYDLLVVTCDGDRAIAGSVSRQWLQSEREDWLRLSDVSPSTLATVRGREVLCDALMPDLDADPESIDVATLAAQTSISNRFISSNALPKLEPTIAAEVLLGNMLLGVQKYGNRRRGSPSLDNDLIIAAMIRNTLGRMDRYSAGLPGDCQAVTQQRLEELFGRKVVSYVVQLQRYQGEFNRCYAANEIASMQLPRAFASVLAAIEASVLRLVARAAGDEILTNLDAAKRSELSRKGIDCSGDFPELKILYAQYHRTRAALTLPGVDYSALREPLEHTLMVAVADTLENPIRRRRLVGRRGKAIHDVHWNLPLVESWNATENINALATVHLAALEMMHHLEKGRRKSSSTMLGHSLRIAAIAERLLGAELEPCIVSAAILHDVVEDGSRLVAGYDQSLERIKLRFGGPLAAMVAELTDAPSGSAAFEKAQATLHNQTLTLPKEQYNIDRFTEMALEPTAAHEPYTLGGIVVKLIDTAMSEEEGIRDPDIMPDWWRHSGIRIFWAHNVRGRIVRPLLLKLTQEIERYGTVPNEFDPSCWSLELIEGLRGVVAFSIHFADQYAVQNLAILADEHQLSVPERDQLIRGFFDPNLAAEAFERELIPQLLSVERLDASIAAGKVPQRNYVTLYGKSKGCEAVRDCSTFLQYRAAALRRTDISRRLQLGELQHQQIERGIYDVVWLYDWRKVA